MRRTFLSAVHLGRKFALSEQASIAITSALALPALLGVAGLALEFGDAMVTRSETQRVADLAAHSGILAFDRDGMAAMSAAVQSVVTLNGYPADTATVVLDQSSGTSPVLRVTIITPRPLVLAQLVAARQSIDIQVRSAATLNQSDPACVQALDPNGTGIMLSGGTTMSTAQCAVASNASVSAIGGSTIVTEVLSYDSDTPPNVSGGAQLRAPDGGATQINRAATIDGVAGHPAIAISLDRLAQVAAMVAPAMPVTSPASNMNFGWNQSATKQQATAVGCSANMSGNLWSFDCPNGADIQLGNMTIAGGLNVDFATAGDGSTAFSFSGSVSNTGAILRFGRGDYKIAGGVFTGGGTYHIGPLATTCGGVRGYSICNTSAFSVAGPSDFQLVGGVRNTGGATLTLGTGDTNSFHIGPAQNGAAITLDSGSNATFGATTGAGNTFKLIGNITTSGGTCLSIGASEHHDIAGYLQLEGGVDLGAGLYTIDGFVHFGASGGGSVWCQGESVSLRALDASFVISGARLAGPNQNCNGLAAFCANSGYSSMKLVAPTTGPFASIAVIGPLSQGVTAGASFGGGASGSQISGAFYFPNGPITLSGGASTGSVNGGCLQLIGATITLSGGTAATSDCNLSGASGGAMVR